MKNKIVNNIGEVPVMEKPENMKINSFWINRFRYAGSRIILDYQDKNNNWQLLDITASNRQQVKKQYPEIKRLIGRNLEATRKKIDKKYLAQNKKVVKKATNGYNGIIGHTTALSVLSIALIFGSVPVKAMSAIILGVAIPFYVAEIRDVIAREKKNKANNKKIVFAAENRQYVSQINNLLAKITKLTKDDLDFRQSLNQKIQAMFNIDINDIKLENAQNFKRADYAFMKSYLEKVYADLLNKSKFSNNNSYSFKFNPNVKRSIVSSNKSLVKKRKL